MVSAILQVSLAAWVLAACGSSSDDRTSTSSDSGTRGDASDRTPACTAFGAPACETGTTCCLSGLSGTCKELRACTSSVQFECQGPTGCATGKVCCASIPLDQVIDASALTPEGGLGALGVTATSFCASSCSSPSFSLCGTASDCANGAICTMLPEGAPILLALGAETLTVCAPPDGGMSLSDGAFESSDSAGETSDAPRSD